MQRVVPAARPSAPGLIAVLAAALVTGCTATASPAASSSPSSIVATSTATPTTAASNASPTTPAATATATASPTVGPLSPTLTPMARPSCKPRSSLRVAGTVWPEAKSFGILDFFDGAYVYIDPAEFLTGDAATKAAREDGHLGKNEELLEPYYIRNEEEGLVRVPVTADFRLTYLAATFGGIRNRTLTRDAAARVYCQGDTAKLQMYAGDWVNLYMNVRTSGGRVSRLNQEYVP